MNPNISDSTKDYILSNYGDIEINDSEIPVYDTEAEYSLETRAYINRQEAKRLGLKPTCQKRRGFGASVNRARRKWYEAKDYKLYT